MKINTKNLKKLGFWKEYTSNPEDESILNAKFDIENLYKKRILEYLNSGIEILLTRGAKRCKLDEKIFAPHGKIYFDGYWIWSEGLIYYFEKHGLKLPSDFLNFLENNNYSIQIKKENLNEDSLELMSNLAYSLIESDW